MVDAIERDVLQASLGALAVTHADDGNNVFPKSLLIAGCAPGVGHVGEIILGDLVRHVGLDRVRCVALTKPRATWTPAEDLAQLQVSMLRSNAASSGRWGSSKWGAVGATFHQGVAVPLKRARLLKSIIVDARAAGVEQVFAVLDNPEVFALAHRLADGLGMPLKTLVWDPPGYLLQLARFDRWSRQRSLREFARSLARSSAVAVVSETMREDYAAFTQAPISILRHGLCKPPSLTDKGRESSSTSEWVIGFAGSMYSPCAWNALLRALDLVGWVVAGRPVRLRLLTASIELASRKPARIEFLGFRTPAEVQTILADCHLCYMPQPFRPHLRDLCRYSFPTKLSNYLDVGRPVLVHSPPEGALSEFYARHPIGVHANSQEPAEIIAALEALLADTNAYQRACEQVAEVAQAHFSQAVFHAAIDHLLGRRQVPQGPIASSQVPPP